MRGVRPPARLITALGRFQPDVAILDIGLPVMDGFELAGRFADHPSLRQARLIALTGYGQREDHERTAAARAPRVE